MSSVNNVILSGRLGKDPEMKYVPSGKPVTHFPLAVPRTQLLRAKRWLTERLAGPRVACV